MSGLDCVDDVVRGAAVLKRIVLHFSWRACVLLLIFAFASPTIQSLLTAQSLEEIVPVGDRGSPFRGCSDLHVCRVGVVDPTRT